MLVSLDRAFWILWHEGRKADQGFQTRDRSFCLIEHVSRVVVAAILSGAGCIVETRTGDCGTVKLWHTICAAYTVHRTFFLSFQIDHMNVEGTAIE